MCRNKEVTFSANIGGASRQNSRLRSVFMRHSRCLRHVISIERLSISKLIRRRLSIYVPGSLRYLKVIGSYLFCLRKCFLADVHPKAKNKKAVKALYLLAFTSNRKFFPRDYSYVPAWQCLR